jgi:hypothetical protein
VNIAIRKVPDWAALAATKSFVNVIEKCTIPAEDFESATWTLALVEKLKEKAEEITLGRLKWVLATAMPGGLWLLFVSQWGSDQELEGLV